MNACLTIMLVLAAASAAFNVGQDHPAKLASSLAPNVPDPTRQGGDTIADAVIIEAVPFATVGTTTGFANDYDEVCPYVGSTAPDVVYAYTPTADLEVDIDMQGSEYDTKIYVYDTALNLVACNDDFYPDYVSRLQHVALLGGMTYYLVIDGFGTSHGDYTLAVTEGFPCILECPPGGFVEGEPPLVDDYLDNYNGGCDSAELGAPMQVLHGDGSGQLVLCGVAGWYTRQGSPYRDTDWYVIDAGAGGVVEVVGDAEQPSLLYHLGVYDCDSFGDFQSVEIGGCAPGSMSMTCYPGTTNVLLVCSTTFVPPHFGFPPEYNYVLHLDGLATPVSTESVSWSAVKGLFR